MGRWMALDVGSKTIGVALSDGLHLSARPLTTLSRGALDSDIAALLELAGRHEVERILVGRPIRLTGEESEIIEAVRPIFDGLSQTGRFEVRWAEERLSSKEAELLMKELRIPVRVRRRRRNEFAAALILKWYLEESSHD